MEMPEIKASRALMGMTQDELAERMGLRIRTYQKKAAGRSTFTDEEKVKLSEILGWTAEQMNERLYGGVLPIGK